MKSLLTRSLVLLATLFFGTSLAAQDAPTLQSSNIVIKTIDKDGNVLINKFRVSEGQDIESVLEKLDMDQVESLEVRIESNEGTNFKFKTNDEEHILALKENAAELSERLERKEHHLHQMHWQMQQHQGEKKALLGIYPKDTPTGEGVLITGIVANSGAQKAGLQKDDILLTINGQSTADNNELRQILSQFKPNEVVALTYKRNGAALQTQATLGEKESHGSYYQERDPCKVFIGVTISGRSSEGGVRVSGIVPGTAAEKHKVQKGDVILAMDDVAVNSFNELLTERNKHEAGDLFTLTILRDGQTMDLDAQFTPCDKQEEPTPATGMEEPVEELIIVEEAVSPGLQLDNSLKLEVYKAFPNPTYGGLQVEFQAEAIPTTVQVTDATGKIVHQETLNQFNGNYSQQLDLRNATPGVLLLTIQQGDKTVTEKIILLARA